MRIVFFGSPEYAVPSLRACLDVPGAEVIAVVTQPDRPRGRSAAPLMTPVKEAAIEAGGSRRVLQPERIRRDTTEAIAALRPDVGVVAASGHILPTHLLEVFPHDVLNVHASLLPKYRGASPVAAAILHGDHLAGATIMRVVRELDAGPIVDQVEVPITDEDTTGTLTETIAEAGAALLARVLPHWVGGEMTPREQPEVDERYRYAPRLTKDDGVIDWSHDARDIARMVRAYNPWPLATTTYRGEPFAILQARPDASIEGAPGLVGAGGRVAAGNGSLQLLRVQRAGRRALPMAEFLNGDRGFIGAVLG